jgi:ribonuclease P protein component
LDRAHRLRKGAEFDDVYTFGAVSGGRLLVVRVLPNDLGHPRWGFAVGKRLSKRATVRNRLKRRLKAVADGLQLILSIDIVVTARAAALVAGTDELGIALRKGVERAALAATDAPRLSPQAVASP